MSVKMRKINRPEAGDHVPKSSLANAMSQGTQEKHACSHTIADAMNQGGGYNSAKGSPHKSLGGVMEQGGSKRRG